MVSRCTHMAHLNMLVVGYMAGYLQSCTGNPHQKTPVFHFQLFPRLCSSQCTTTYSFSLQNFLKGVQTVFKTLFDYLVSYFLVFDTKPMTCEPGRRKDHLGVKMAKPGFFAQIIIWLKNNVQSAKQCLSCIHKAFKKHKWNELNTFINVSIHFLTHDDAF